VAVGSCRGSCLRPSSPVHICDARGSLADPPVTWPACSRRRKAHATGMRSGTSIQPTGSHHSGFATTPSPGSWCALVTSVHHVPWELDSLRNRFGMREDARPYAGLNRR
jgi:hypothetical protein